MIMTSLLILAAILNPSFSQSIGTDTRHRAFELLTGLGLDARTALPETIQDDDQQPIMIDVDATDDLHVCSFASASELRTMEGEAWPPTPTLSELEDDDFADTEPGPSQMMISPMFIGTPRGNESNDEPIHGSINTLMEFASISNPPQQDNQESADETENTLPVNFLQCTLCEFSTNDSGGLVRHLTTRHSGNMLGAATCELLCGLGRGICPNNRCSAIRPNTSRSCHRCRTGDPSRLALASDHIQRGDPIANIARPDAPREQIDVPPEFPTRFLDRIRQLPPATEIHTPVAFRERLCVSMADALEGVLDGRPELEEARSKLLLSNIPHQLNRRVEFEKRFRLWKDKRFGELLTRIEGQNTFRKKTTHTKRSSNRSQKSSRAKMLTREGVYGRVVQSVSSDVATLTQDAQRG